MGRCLNSLGALTLLAAVGLGYIWYRLDRVPELPQVGDPYWGPGREKPDDVTIRPFKIDIPEKDVQDLKTRLENTRTLRPPLEGVGFEYGTNTQYLNSILSYWRTKYDWRKRELFLNQFPQFKTQISGLNMHYIHVKPDSTKLSADIKVLPLLLMHGWPGSVREFYQLIPMLTTPRQGVKFVFEVIAPSLPGYGFSEGPSKTGMGAPQMAVVMKKLMARLGHDKFYIQGGDWGSAVGMAASIIFPESVIAYHSNMCIVRSPKTIIKMIAAYLMPSYFADSERQAQMLTAQPLFLLKESGYFHMQATKPDTVGVALTDSPAGLAAYILEKFSVGTDPSWINRTDGGLNSYSKDDLLDNLMIYWFTNSITSAIRVYKEAFIAENASFDFYKGYVTVPTACAVFPNEIIHFPGSVLRDRFRNLVKITEMPRGGHFAAFQVPELLADDVWEFVAMVTSQPKTEEKKKNTK